MRIISGKFRSRLLLSPRDAMTTRPMPDRVKESLFGLLRGNCDGANVLDCFAGTGAVGLEAISRGAARCVFVERDRKVADLLEQNIAKLGCEDQCEVVRADALGPATLSRAPRPVTLAFFDPPYPLVWEPQGWDRVRRQFGRVIDLLGDDGFAMLRTPWPFRHEELVHSDGRREWRSPLVGMAERRQRRFEQRRHPDHLNEDEQEQWSNKEWVGDAVDIDEIKAESDAALQDWRERQDRQEAQPEFELVRHEVDLTFPNAEGPETHAYASQAVHLYMKRKPEA
ncbi:MAG: RsmD family RNA methyltransferase [Phycisphaerales bacterium]|nr:RsmD family RNA methyltransferase [Phycisphaerales bacterium]